MNCAGEGKRDNIIPLKKSIFVVFLVLLLDQSLKFWVKTHFLLGEEINIAGNWFILHFTENNGMAFGLEFNGANGKLFLSIFRIIAVAGIAYYLYTLSRSGAHKGLLISIALILAGAIGNIIDSAFYGLIFSESYHDLAKVFSGEGGYAPFLHGRVVDMLYFPIFEGHFPHWFPFWGSESFIFFRPVFNIADSAITIGVLMIIIFQRKFFKETKTENQEPAPIPIDPAQNS